MCLEDCPIFKFGGIKIRNGDCPISNLISNLIFPRSPGKQSSVAGIRTSRDPVTVRCWVVMNPISAWSSISLRCSDLTLQYLFYSCRVVTLRDVVCQKSRPSLSFFPLVYCEIQLVNRVLFSVSFSLQCRCITYQRTLRMEFLFSAYFVEKN